MSVRSAAAASTSAASRQPGLAALCWSRVIVELKQFFRNTQAAVFLFSFPLIMLVIFGAIFNDTLPGVPPGASPVTFRQYFVAGMVATGIMSVSFNSLAISIATEQHEGLLKRLSGTPLPRVAYFAGKVGLAIVATACESAIMLGVGVVLFGLKLPADPSRWGVFMGVMGLGVASCAICAVAYTRIIPNANSAPAIVTPVYLVLQFISGVFFRFDQLPAPMRIFASIFPLRWMALGLRYAFLPDWFKTQETGGQWNIGLVFIVLGAWLVFGFLAARRFFRWDRGVGGA